MNPRSTAIPRRILVLAITVLSLSPSLPTAAAPAPRYRFVEGQTNAYRITLETEFQDSPVSLSGIVYAHGIPLPDGNIHLSVLGRLSPERRRSGRGAPPVHPFGGGPGHPMGAWMPRLIHIPPGYSATLDPSGRVVRDSGPPQGLPSPFDSLIDFLVEPLPEGTRRERSLDGTLSVPDDLPYAAGQGFQPPNYGFYPGRSGPRLPVQCTGTSKLTEAPDNALHITSTLELTSLMKSGSQPRLAASIQRQAVFDRKRGLLTSLDLTSTTALTTPSFSLRRPVTLRVRLLEGEELAREELDRETDNPLAPRPITPADLDGVLADLTSADPGRRSTAATRLITAEIQQPTPALLTAAGRMASDPDPAIRTAGQRILGLHGGETEIPAMIRALPWSAMGGSQRELLAGLRRLRDPRAIDAFADTIARGSMDIEFAAECLQDFGPAAEPAALRLLKERHGQTRRLACQVLGRVGAAASLNPVREQISDPDPQVNQAAGDALRSIQARTDNHLEVSQLSSGQARGFPVDGVKIQRRNLCTQPKLKTHSTAEPTCTEATYSSRYATTSATKSCPVG